MCRLFCKLSITGGFVKKREVNYTATAEDRSLWLQAFATYVSRITNKFDTTQIINKIWRGKYIETHTINSSQILNRDTETIAYLISQCLDNKVVMVNENHFTTQHRMLLYILLDSLYKIGYNYLAMEALWENDSVLNQRAFTVTNTGLYTREPMMSNIIRKAFKLGYKIIGYDDFSTDRETQQAKNIYNKTLLQDSTAKVLVFAGFDHIDERKMKMAKKFHQISNINPLTINQTDYNNRLK